MQFITISIFLLTNVHVVSCIDSLQRCTVFICNSAALHPVHAVGQLATLYTVQCSYATLLHCILCMQWVSFQHCTLYSFHMQLCCTASCACSGSACNTVHCTVFICNSAALHPVHAVGQLATLYTVQFSYSTLLHCILCMQ